jgi:hypothetical protein
MGFYPHSQLTDNNNIDSIPFVAYGMIGITTLVLAYATLMDVDKEDDISASDSATSLLPPITQPSSPETSNDEVEPPPLPEDENLGNVPMAPIAPLIPPAPGDELDRMREDEEGESGEIRGGKKINNKKHTRRRRNKN